MNQNRIGNKSLAQKSLAEENNPERESTGSSNEVYSAQEKHVDDSKQEVEVINQASEKKSVTFLSSEADNVTQISNGESRNNVSSKYFEFISY